MLNLTLQISKGKASTPSGEVGKLGTVLSMVYSGAILPIFMGEFWQI